MITQAQRAAVKAAELPFVLSDADITRQFAEDGSVIARPTRDAMRRVTQLSRQEACKAALPKAA